jgi:hypothetical protein
MNRSQLSAKLAKERARTSSRYEFLQGKQASSPESHHAESTPVGNTASGPSTAFIAVLEPVGNGGHRVYIPGIAVRNAGVHAGDAVEVTIRRAARQEGIA